MAVTSYGVGANEAVKLWSRKLWHEALKATWVYKFMGRDSNAVLQVVDDTSKSPGDRIRFTLRMLLTGDGVLADGTLEGNEEALVTYTDDVFIDQLRHAVRSGGRMSEQRIPFSVREEARLALQDWWSDRIDTWFFNQVGSNASQTNLAYTGLQTATTATRQIQHPNATSVTSISTSLSHAFSLGLIDVAVEQAKTTTPQIRPIRVNGNDKYVCILHPTQVRALRTQYGGSAGAIVGAEWGRLHVAGLQGGEGKTNPIYSGAIGEYNGTILHESVRVPNAHDNGSARTGTRAAIFLGAQAAVMAFGRGYGASKMSWTEELFDYQNQLGVSAGLIGGLKKATYNASDFAAIVINTHGATAGAVAG